MTYRLGLSLLMCRFSMRTNHSQSMEDEELWCV
jgi:hypothetical protein